MLVRRKGARRVVVKSWEGSFEVGVPFEEVVEFLTRLWPWEAGWHYEVGNGEVAFRDRIPFERAVAYLLARRGGLSPAEAEAVAAYLRQHELAALTDAFLYRMWLCKRAGGRCKGVTDAFAKMAVLYRKVILDTWFRL